MDEVNIVNDLKRISYIPKYAIRMYHFISL